MKTKERLAIDPEVWVKTYGEVISPTKAAHLVGRNPSYITRRVKDGRLDSFRDGVSVRQLALYEMSLAKKHERMKGMENIRQE